MHANKNEESKKLVDTLQKSLDVEFDFFFKNVSKRIKIVDFGSIEKPKLVFELLLKPEDCNISGNAHGGFIASLIDICSTTAIVLMPGKYI
jgi:acyl-coenzyme A thioesterase PaaI-like protein